MIVRALFIVVFTAAFLCAAQPGWDEAALPRLDPEGVAHDPVAGDMGLVAQPIMKHGMAVKAGLREGDRVVGLDGWRIWGADEFQWVCAFAGNVETPLEVAILRQGKVTTLHFAGKHPRTGGFTVRSEIAALDKVLSDAGILADRSVDPLAWRAWQAFPPRMAAEAVRWHRAADAGARSHPAWLLDLDRRWRACVVQDFAAAAAGDRPPAPTPTLESFAAFVQRLAKRNAHGEQPPDPAACGVSPMTFVLWNPWPLVVGSPVGPWPEPGFKALIESCRLLPAKMHVEREECEQQAFALPLASTTTIAHSEPYGSDHYLTTVRAAMVDPERQGGWPYRHDCVQKEDSRRRVLADLDKRAAGPKGDAWAGCCASLVRFKDGLRLDDLGTWGPALTKLKPEVLTLAKRSPWLAARTLEIAFTYTCTNQGGLGYLRREFRAAFTELSPQITMRPSVLLSHLQARDPGHILWRSMDLIEGGWPAAVLLRALIAERPLAELEAEIGGLGDDAPIARRKALMAEFLDRHRGRLDWDDAALLRRLAGESTPLGCGALLDLLPEALLWHAVPGRDNLFWTNIKLVDFPDARDFDLATIDATAAKVPGGDPSAAAAAVESLRLSFGHPLAALRLADVCSAHGLEATANTMRDGVRRYYAAFLAYQKAQWFDAPTLAESEWEALMVFASSPATATEALEHGQIHLADRRDKDAWTCSHLSLAQALLELHRPEDAARHLQLSFTGVESKGQEPFVGSFGLIRGEPAMRTWLLEQLAKAGALPAARAAILKSAKPAMLTPRALEVLEATADQLGGGGAPTAGASDF